MATGLLQVEKHLTNEVYDLSSQPQRIRHLPVSSAGVASAASTCSPPPAPDSICWSSGGGRSGRVASSSLGCGSRALPVSGCPPGRSGAGVAELGFGSSNTKADDVLTKQNSIYHQNKSKSRRYIMNTEVHLQRGLLQGWLLQPQYPWFYNHSAHCWWRGYTSRGREMPRRGTRYNNGHDRCRRS
jgi:hypothetical protein